MESRREDLKRVQLCQRQSAELLEERRSALWNRTHAGHLHTVTKSKFETNANFVTAERVNYFWLDYLKSTNAPTDDPEAEKFSDYGKFLVGYTPRGEQQGQYYPGNLTN
jgi:hypothetical protein